MHMWPLHSLAGICIHDFYSYCSKFSHVTHLSPQKAGIYSLPKSQSQGGKGINFGEHIAFFTISYIIAWQFTKDAELMNQVENSV